MAISNRTALLTKTVKVLRKHYQPVPPSTNRSLFEHLLLGCCLENSMPADAEQVFKTLNEQFFDWNEVRVSTVRELAEAMQPLTEPEDAARRLRNILQSVFESAYAFDLEELKRQNIGQAVKQLEGHRGTTSFAISYVVQAALGGHSIPVNRGAIRALVVVGAVSEAEAAEGRVPGLERAIPKGKGIEAGSLLHQWGVDFHCHPHGTTMRKLLIEIAPDCKQRLPKRPTKKAGDAAETAPATRKEPAKKATKEEPATDKTGATAAAAKSPPRKKPAAAKKKTSASKKKTAARKPPTADKKTTAKKPAAKKKTPRKPLAKTKPR
jgi:endonuclease III